MTPSTPPARRGAEVFRSLCSQAGITVRELTDLVDAHGLPEPIRLAVGKAERRKHGRHLVAARRRLVKYYESMW